MRREKYVFSPFGVYAEAARPLRGLRRKRSGGIAMLQQGPRYNRRKMIAYAIYGLFIICSMNLMEINLSKL